MQHATINIPNRKFGYCIDDNDRALILSVLAYKNLNDKKFLDLSYRYLDYIKFMQKDDGWFHNFLSYNLKFQDKIGSEDSFGRTIWALGFTIFHNINKNLTQKAIKIFNKSKSNINKLNHLRAKSFAILGLCYFYKYKKDIKIKRIINKYANDLCSSFQRNKTKKWLWFESGLTYANALLPYAMLLAYQIINNKKYLKIGLKSFNFLLDVCQEKDIPIPIGYKGWYFKGKKKSIYGQQPIDPAWMIISSCKAFEITKNKKYFQSAIFWFSWFWGNNIIHKIIINQKTSGVFDGIEKAKVNFNQGAESTICYLLAFLTLKEICEINQK